MRAKQLLILLVVYSSDYVDAIKQSERIEDEDAGLSFVRNKSRLWSNGIIPFKFLDTRFSGKRYESKEKEMIRGVMNRMENQLGTDCIKFKEIEEGVECDVCVKFDKSQQDVCQAHIGSSSESYITLESPECFADNGATIMHELGHVLGMVHEQSRPDRDQYIEILDDLVLYEAKSQMKIREKIFGETYQTPYDLFSVMHYPATSGCKNNTTCIRVKQPFKNFFASEGKDLLTKYPEELSPVDIYEISAAYNCSLKPETVENYVEYVATILTVQTEHETAKACPSTTCDNTSTSKVSTDLHECLNYDILDEPDRSISNGEADYCDMTDLSRQKDYVQTSPRWSGSGWYRIIPPAGTRMPIKPPGQNKCGTFGTGWINGTLPKVQGDSVEVLICFSRNSGSCYLQTLGKVSHCGLYYVYYLPETSSCSLRYCSV